MDISADKRKVAEQWLAAGHGSDDPFDSFSNYWRGFASLLPASKASERQRISAFLTAAITEEVAGAILQECQNHIPVLVEKPVIDVRMPERTSKDQLERYAKSTNNADRLDALMMVVYLVRCNLEHGHKAPDSLRDQHLCEAAATMVVAVTSRCI